MKAILKDIRSGALPVSQIPGFLLYLLKSIKLIIKYGSAISIVDAVFGLE